MGTETTQVANQQLLTDIRDLLSGIDTDQGPLDKYKIHDEDSLGLVKYYGFASKENEDKWIVLRQNTTSSPFVYRYANISNNSGQANYQAAWTNRSSLNYDYLFNLTGV